MKQDCKNMFVSKFATKSIRSYDISKQSVPVNRYGSINTYRPLDTNAGKGWQDDLAYNMTENNNFLYTIGKNPPLL